MAHAQPVSYGPKVGPNVSIFRGKFPYPGQKGPHFGYSFGGFMNFKSAKNKQFQFEINFLYTMRGNSATYADSSGPEENKIAFRCGYIEIPLLFKYMLNRGGTIRPYLFAGPVYSGLVNSKYIQKYPNAVEKDSKNWFKRDDLGIMVGWGLTNFIIDRWYSIDIRYYHGFLNQSDNVVGENLFEFSRSNSNTDIIKIRNSTLTFTFCVALNRQLYFK